MGVAGGATVGSMSRWWEVVTEKGANLTVKPGCWRAKSVPCTYSL